MPQVTVYIRDKDLKKWKSIEKKSEWLHNALLGQPDAYLVSTKVAKENPELVEQFDKAVEPFVPRPPDPETGYPCCQKEKRCKHWEFDGLMSAWVNIYTGKMKEVL